MKTLGASPNLADFRPGPFRNSRPQSAGRNQPPVEASPLLAPHVVEFGLIGTME